MNADTSTTDGKTADYAGYEYTTIRAPRQLENLYRDAYRNFGWNFERSEVRPLIRPLPLLPAIRSNTATLSFKRDRNIKRQPMMQDLQHKVNVSLASIARMERSEKSTAVLVAAVLGIIGAGFLAVSMFIGAVSTGAIILGAIGLVAWVGGAIAYFGIKSARTARLDPLIDQEQTVIFETGEQAARLIH